MRLIFIFLIILLLEGCNKDTVPKTSLIPEPIQTTDENEIYTNDLTDVLPLSDIIAKDSRNRLLVEVMKVYDEQNYTGTIPEERLQAFKPKDKASELYYYDNDELYILLYKENKQSPFYIMINDQKLIFNDDTRYDISTAQSVMICLYDLNNDEIPDIIISDNEMYHSICDNIYLSVGNGKYDEIGSIGFKWLGSDKIPKYTITLLDNYKVLVEMKELGIKGILSMVEFEDTAFKLGWYDEAGKATDYGKGMVGADSKYCSAYPQIRNYLTDDTGQFFIQIIAPITTGYSSFEFDGGFIFEWIINTDENVYELTDVKIFAK